MEKISKNITEYSNDKLIKEMIAYIKRQIEVIDNSINVYEKDNWSNFKKIERKKDNPN